jgi:CspA family cold shock protein
MLEGRLITWREDKGYGFVEGQAHRDIFVHRRDVKFEHRYKMSEGLRVSYRLEQSEKGPIAKDVKILLLS